ncbi:MAG: Tetratricopeptide (TPR) repeat [Pelagibacterales bacterium]|nr:Tetratricopeptide (TPR) repeat [Pelagibacterales bacterium]
MKKIEKKIEEIVSLFKSKKLLEAEKYNKALIIEYPKVVYLYNLLGLILTEQNKLKEALEYYNCGLKFDPTNSMIYNNIGTIYKSTENFFESEANYKKSIELNKQSAESHNNLGILYLAMNRYKDSVECFKTAIEVNKNFFPSYYNLANSYYNTGDFISAKKYFLKTILLNPKFYSAHRNLSQIIKYNKENPHFKELKNLFDDKSNNLENKTEISFALGKAFEDIKNYDKSFYFYNIGNDLRRKKIKFSIKEEKKKFDNIKKIFNKNIFTSDGKKFNSSEKPIFIVGMPRSGTTLVEQIISNHPNVFGGDELNYFPNLIEKKFGSIENIDLENINDMKIIATEYIKKLNNLSNNSKKVTDKLPVNFLNIGLIKLILPGAKIIHCERNPKDNCFSIFKNYFVNPKLNFAYNLEELSQYYNLYADLMNHWKKTLPSFIFDLRYEKIINEPDKEIKKMIKFCNLNWDVKCLNFHENKRPIKTTSANQAREKIYSTSINSWLNYNVHLKKTFSKLNS